MKLKSLIIGVLILFVIGFTLNMFRYNLQSNVGDFFIQDRFTGNVYRYNESLNSFFSVKIYKEYKAFFSEKGILELKREVLLNSAVKEYFFSQSIDLNNMISNMSPEQRKTFFKKVKSLMMENKDNK